MGLTVQVEPKKDYLLIILSGSYSLDGTVEVFDKILKICEELKATKVMVDVGSPTGVISDMDRFHFGENFATRYLEEKKAGKISHIRFAFLGNYPVVDPGKFGETVAVNRGLTLKVTTDLNEALDWLLVDSSAGKPLPPHGEP